MTTAETQNRRQRRIERRKQRILNAAAHIFAEKGYAQATTREIAEASDMAEGTLYNYFGGKREILMSILDETQVSIDALFANANDISTKEDAIEFVARSYRILFKQLSFTRTLLTEVWIDDMVLKEFLTAQLLNLGERVKNLITRRVHAGIFRPVDPAVSMRIVLATFIAPVMPVLRGIQPCPSPEEQRALAEQVVAFVISGFGVRAHQEA